MTREIVIRKMRDEDARYFLEVHHAAVRGIAAKDTPRAVIDDWAPLPITEKNIAGFLKNPDKEIRLVAETNGEIVGIDALVEPQNELRACDVAPNASRQGVGSALVRPSDSAGRNATYTCADLESEIRDTDPPVNCCARRPPQERGRSARLGRRR